MRGVAVLALLLAVVVETTAAAATAPDADRDGIADGVDNCPAIWNTDQADSDGNGIGDLCEASWAARDDDRDGISNGADNCPLEPNADQSPLACAMRAITVPESPSNPMLPHATYSGATITLKGIARYGGNQSMWDFGDGTMPQPWTAISNPYNLGVRHIYTGSVGQNFTATLSVRSSAAPEIVSSASYRVQIMLASNLADPAQLDVRVRMAIDEAMWFLHQGQSRGTYADGAPGYRQPFGVWQDNIAGHTTCAAVDLFALHGSRPDANYGSDPYVEDVRRGLTYLLASAKVGAISSQPAGNPDGNGNGVGVYLGNYGDDIETTGLCAKAFADTRAANRQALSGPAGVYGRLHKDIVQDTVDWFAFGQNDTGSARGAWGYTPNQQFGEMRLNVWPILALLAAEQQIGAVVPAFVRAETWFYFNYARHAALDTFNGGWGFLDSNAYVAMGVTGGGLVAFNFRGGTASAAEAMAALGFMYRHWQDTGATTWCWDAYLGNTYAMFPVAMALKTMSPPPADVTEYNYSTGQQTTNRFDWYSTPAGQVNQGLATHLVTRQSATGQWNDTTGCGYLVGGAVTALDAIILLKEDVVPKPQATLCNCDFTWDKDSDVTFDGSCSDANNPARRLVKFEWDFNYDGTTFRPSTAGDGLPVIGTIVVKVGGFPAYGTYPVALRVTDDTPAEAGGAQTSVASCSITIKPSPHCPHVDAGGPYFGARDRSIQLAASKTADVDGDAVTFEWDLDNDGMFDDAVGETVSPTFSIAGTFVIAVQATDHPPDGLPCARVAYSTAKIGGADVSLLTPGRPAATAISGNAVLVLWEPVTEAEQYELWRSQEGRSYAPLWKTSGTSFVDSTRPGLTSLYEVRTISSGGPSALSPPDAATTIVFSDRDLVGRTVRALHIDELRQAVDAMRLAARLSPGNYANKISPSTTIRAVDLEELRTILEKTRNVLALPFMGYEETIRPGVTSIKAAHFLELRAGTQ